MDTATNHPNTPVPPAEPDLPAPADTAAAVAATDPDATACDDGSPTAIFTLADLVAAGIIVAHLPAAGVDIALFGAEPDGTISVLYADGRIEPLDPATRAVPLADPIRGAAALTEILARQDAHHAEQLSGLTAERAALERAHQRRLGEIRDYAVTRYLDDEICRTGLEAFLDHFGLEPYQPRLAVTFTLHGRYSVEADDADCVRSDARYGLRVDVSDLADVVDGSLLVLGTDIEVQPEASDD